MRVTRCVCLGLTFDELKARAVEHGDTFEALRERTGCCTGCGACEPYVRLMLETGQTRFPVLRRHGNLDGEPGSPLKFTDQGSQFDGFRTSSEDE